MIYLDRISLQYDFINAYSFGLTNYLGLNDQKQIISELKYKTRIVGKI